MDNEILYGPCPCGSGKKYKFCCYTRKPAEKSGLKTTYAGLHKRSDDDTDFILAGDFERGEKLSSRGYACMQQGAYEEAIAWFRQSIDAAPFIPSPYNNMALCLYAVGNLREAIRAQQAALPACALPNPFGVCNLAMFHLVINEHETAEAYLDQALKMDLPNDDARIKLCETLARFGRHREILKQVDSASVKEGCRDVFFFSGIAAANLEMYRRAEADLERVRISHPKHAMIVRYIDCLKKKATPKTVNGSWLYFLAYEICPIAYVEKILKGGKKNKKEIDKWLTGLTLIEFCTALLNEDRDECHESAVDMLARAKHPEAMKLLRTLVNGDIGSDELRLSALRYLDELGEIDGRNGVKISLKGQRQKVVSSGISLNSEHVYGDLPKQFRRTFEKGVKAQSKGKYEQAGKLFEEIMEGAPEFYPACLNYAVTLVNRGIYDEAERLLRELVSEHPTYLFAHAALLQLFLNDQRMDEAKALFENTNSTLPEETHPSAMSAWLAAQAIYYMQQDLLEEAGHCVELALKIDSGSLSAINAKQALAYMCAE